MESKAAILGATGLVGSHLLQMLLEDDYYDQVIVYGRRSTGIEHPKLREILGDLLDDDFFEQGIKAEDVYCCIGTTQSKTPDLSVYKKIDYGIPVRAAKAGLTGGMQKFLVVSSMGANPSSKTFYSRTKGQMEAALQRMAIPRLHLFRPSLLMGERDENRLGENIAAALFKVFGWAIPKKYKGIQASTVARAMHHVARNLYDKEIIESDEIREMG